MISAFEIRQFLIENGWHVSKRDDDSVTLKKRAGQAYLSARIFNSFYSRKIYLSITLPKSVSYTEMDRFSREVSYDDLTQGLPRAQSELIALYNDSKPKRRSNDRASFKWNGLQGKQAFKSWRLAASRFILRQLDEQYRAWERLRSYKNVSLGLSTRIINELVEDNYELDPDSYEDLKKEVRALLKILERKKLIERDQRQWVRFPDSPDL